jgi:hypothetical protein
MVMSRSKLSAVIGIAVGVLFLLAVGVVLYTAFIWGPAHNRDRCAEGYVYAADGTACP